MEPMKKDQLLFSKDDEQRIDQFGYFRDTEYRDPTKPVDRIHAHSSGSLAYQ